MSLKIRNVILALLLTLFFSIVMTILTGLEHLTAVFLLVGFVPALVLLFKVEKPGFWFCLIFAIEWALLPISALIAATQASGFGDSLGAAIFLSITVPPGLVGFLVFGALAIWRYRKGVGGRQLPQTHAGP